MPRPPTTFPNLRNKYAGYKGDFEGGAEEGGGGAEEGLNATRGAKQGDIGERVRKTIRLFGTSRWKKQQHHQGMGVERGGGGGGDPRVHSS